jgi:hypothetical protein
MHNHILAQLPLFGKSGCIFDGGFRQIESSAADASDRHLTQNDGSGVAGCGLRGDGGRRRHADPFCILMQRWPLRATPAIAARSVPA